MFRDDCDCAGRRVAEGTALLVRPAERPDSPGDAAHVAAGVEMRHRPGLIGWTMDVGRIVGHLLRFLFFRAFSGT